MAAPVMSWITSFLSNGAGRINRRICSGRQRMPRKPKTRSNKLRRAYSSNFKCYKPFFVIGHMIVEIV